MKLEDLIKKSPVRKLDKALGGQGLQPGEFGVITSQKGVGKTSMLVQLGLDKLLQGEQVFHISFSQDIDYSLTWYNNMYTELAKHKNLENSDKVKSDVMARRIILNFNQDTITTDNIMSTVNALTEGTKLRPHALMIDDFDFTRAEKEAVAQLKKAAKDLGLHIWFTARADVQGTTPKSLEPFLDDLDVILLLKPISKNEVGITALKNYDTTNVEIDVKFDTKSLLLV